MVSGFLTPGGQLQVPGTVTDAMLLDKELHPHWPQQEDGIPIRNAMMFLEYRKDNYWTREKMVAPAIDIALPIFQVAFPGCQALFAFDNATNHCVYKSDALLASSMNLNPREQQPHMREAFVLHLAALSL